MGKAQQAAGGGKVTVEGLSAAVVKSGETVTVKQGSKAVQSVTGMYKPNTTDTYPSVTFGFYYWNGYSLEGGIGHAANFSGEAMTVQNNLGWRRNSSNRDPMTLNITINTPGVYMVSFGIGPWGTPSTTGYLQVNGSTVLNFGHSGSGSVNQVYTFEAGDSIYLYAAQPYSNQGYEASGAVIKIG